MPTAPPHPHLHPPASTSPEHVSRCLVIYQSNSPQIHLPLIFRFILKVSMFNSSHFSRWEEKWSSLTSNNLTHCEWLFIDSIKDSLMQVNKFAPLFHSLSSLSALLPLSPVLRQRERSFFVFAISHCFSYRAASSYLQLNTRVHRQQRKRERSERG